MAVIVKSDLSQGGSLTSLGGNSPSGAYGAYRQVQTHSHRGPIAVFKKGQTEIWAGSANEVSFRPWDLQITLMDISTDHYAPVPAITGNGAAHKLLPISLFREGVDVPSLVIDWPDFSTPRVSKGWWERLTEKLFTTPPPEGMDEFQVGICCHGGHGRTGTALVILGCLADLIPKDKDPIEYIRTIYCDRIVETASQIRYIEEVTGRSSKAAPCGYGSGYSASGYKSGYSESILDAEDRLDYSRYGDDKDLPETKWETEVGYDSEGNFYYWEGQRIVCASPDEQKEKSIGRFSPASTIQSLVNAGWTVRDGHWLAPNVTPIPQGSQGTGTGTTETPSTGQ